MLIARRRHYVLLKGYTMLSLKFSMTQLSSSPVRFLACTLTGLSLQYASPEQVKAGCPCQQQVPAHSMQAPMVMQPHTDMSADGSFNPMAFPQPNMFMGTNNMQPMPATIAPVQTGQHRYFRTTRLIPADKPPRVAMIDVYTNKTDTVNVYDQNPFREEDEVKGYQDPKNPNLWVFETKALFPGIPHIYKVVSKSESGTESVKYIRMIPGHIVDLEF